MRGIFRKIGKQLQNGSEKGPENWSKALQFVAVSDDFNPQSTDDLLMSARHLKSVQTGVQKTILLAFTKYQIHHFPDTWKMAVFGIGLPLGLPLGLPSEKRNVSIGLPLGLPYP